MAASLGTWPACAATRCALVPLRVRAQRASFPSAAAATPASAAWPAPALLGAQWKRKGMKKQKQMNSLVLTAWMQHTLRSPSPWRRGMELSWRTGARGQTAATRTAAPAAAVQQQKAQELRLSIMALLAVPQRHARWLTLRQASSAQKWLHCWPPLPAMLVPLQLRLATLHVKQLLLRATGYAYRRGLLSEGLCELLKAGETRICRKPKT